MSSYLQAFNNHLAEEDELDNMLLELLNLPAPHSKQSDILCSLSMRKVVAAGRQVGKTMMASMSAIGGEQYGGRGLLDGAHVHISSTTQDQSDLFWDYITEWLAPLFNMPGFHKNEGRRIIRYRGGRIRVKTGKNPDALRGGNVDKLILDECAYLDPKAWKKVGMPMLVARDGVAEFYSTPKGYNWFFELFNYASEEDNQEWAAWNFSTLSNPHLSEAALRLLTKDMSADDYTEEIEAQFISDSGGVFDARRITFLDDWPEYDPTHIYAAGIDWGQDNDFTVLSISDRTANRQVFIGRWRKMPWADMREQIIRALLTFHVTMVRPERNSMGSSQIESLWTEIEEAGLECELLPFTMGGKNKHELITFYRTGLEDHDYGLLDDEAQKREIINFETKRTTTGMYSYSAPSGGHDDTIIAGALSYIAMVSFE